MRDHLGAAICAGLAVGAWAGDCRADLDVALGNNLQADAEIAPADEAETYRLRLPAGAKASILVKARPAKGQTPPQLGFVLLDAAGRQVAAGEAKGKTVRLKRFEAPGSGEYRVVVTGDGANAGRYQLKVKWKAAKRLRRTIELDVKGQEEPFAADAGSAASFKVKAARGSEAQPRLVSVAADAPPFLFDGFTAAPQDASLHAQKKVPLGSAVSYVLTLGNAGDGGTVTLDVKLKAPKLKKTRVDLSDAAFGGDDPGASGGTPLLVFGSVLTPGGGQLTVDDPLAGPILGAGIFVPAGALSQPSAISIGLAQNALPAPGAQNAVGPTVFFGPPGLSFTSDATVTIPFDPSGLEADLDSVEVFAREEDGTVTKVPVPYTFDLVAKTVSFPVSSFTSFRTFAPGLALQATGEILIAAQDGVNGDAFGSAVALDGDILAIGAPGHTTTATRAGAVYTFVRNGNAWDFDRKLEASDPTLSAAFGTSVALHGNTLVVGAPQAQEGLFVTGAAYVFVHDGQTWSQQQRLLGGSSSNAARFGTAVDVEGDVCMIGAPGELAGAVVVSGGAVYEFTRTNTTWTQTQRFEAGTPTQLQQVGSSLDMDGDRLVVGGPGSLIAGVALVFDRVGGDWTETAELLPGDRTFEEDFGASVVLAGDVAVVGDPQHDASADPADRNEGRVFVFARNGVAWPLERSFESNVPEPGAGFGGALGLTDDLLAAGAMNADPQGAGVSAAGVVFLFRRSGGAWTSELDLVRNTPQNLDGFGSAISFVGAELLVGARSTTVGPGSAFVYRVGSAPPAK